MTRHFEPKQRSRPGGAGGEEQPQHVLVWSALSQELVVDRLEAHADVFSDFNFHIR